MLVDQGVGKCGGVVCWLCAHGGGQKTVGNDAASPSSLRSIVKMGVQRAGSKLRIPSSQSEICIAVVRTIFDVGSGRK